MTTQPARYKSTCPICHRAIKPGDTIVHAGRLWVCQDCHKHEPDHDALTDADQMAALRRSSQRLFDYEDRQHQRPRYVDHTSYETAAERSMAATGGTSDCMYDS